MMELQFQTVVPQAKFPGSYGQYPQAAVQQQVQAQVMQQSEPTTVLRLRGLPFEAKESDIRAFFGAYNLVHVHLCRRNGKTTGEAYVQFMTEEQAQQALMNLDRTSMGRRYIELFAAKEIELKKRRAQESQITGSVLRMRGLPFTATPQEIITFFEPLQICQGRHSILLTINANQKPSGEAFVEFPDEETRNEAMSRDRKMIGHRYIELFSATKEDVDKALSQQRFIMRQGIQFGVDQLPLPMIPPHMGGHFIPGQDINSGLDISDFLRGLSLSGSQRPAINGFQNRVLGFQGAPLTTFVSQPLSPQGPKLPGSYMPSIPSGNLVGIEAPQWGQDGLIQPVCSFPPGTSGAMVDSTFTKAHDPMFFQQNSFHTPSSQYMQGMPVGLQDMNVHPGSTGLYHPWSTPMEAPMFPTFVQDPYDNSLPTVSSTSPNTSRFSNEDFYPHPDTTRNAPPLPTHTIPDYLCMNDHQGTNNTAFPIHY